MSRTYYVNSNLNHNGKEFSRGDEITLSSEVAEQLLTDGVIGESQPEVTDPEIEAVKEPEQSQPSVGGAPLSSGEPSIDTRPTETAPSAPKPSFFGRFAPSSPAPQVDSSADGTGAPVVVDESNEVPAGPVTDPSAGL